MELNLLDKMLTDYRTNRTRVTVVLQNKGRVSGVIKAFDSYVLIMDGGRNEIVYRHAVSSIQPFVAEQVQQPAPQPTQQTAQPRQPRPQTQAQTQIQQRPRPAQRPGQAAAKHRSPKPVQPMAAAAPEQSLKNTMQEGLLRWMQEQKASK